MEVASFRLSILDNPGYAQFIRTAEEHKIGDPATPFFEAVESFVNCEVLHRRAERAKKLKLPKADHYEAMAMLHNARGLRRLRTARPSINKALESFPPGLEEIDSAGGIKEVLDENEMLFKNGLLETDLSPEETEEVWAEYGKVRKAVDAGGPRGLMEHLGSKIDELTKARTNLSKGREHASPLAWWKYFAIAGLVALAVALLYPCALYSSCVWYPSWFYAMIMAIQQLISSGC